MTLVHGCDAHRLPAGPAPAPLPGPRPVGRRLLLASRGDALTPYLFDVLAQRYPIAGRIEPELSRLQRLNVAAGTFRPSRLGWTEQFYKSSRGYRMRSANAARQRAAFGRPHDPVFQVHALFEVDAAPSLLYVDCTHEQSAEQWPAWNPLRGQALQRWYAREQRAYTEAVHVFAFSQQTRDSLVHSYRVPAERVSVVGAGMNLDRLPPGHRLKPATTAPTVLFVGNDFARKGGHTLIEAFRRVRLELPQARLQLVGTDPGIAPEPGVEVLGRIRDRRQVAELYRQADLFCLPSFFDPMPLVLLEAMAYGLPVVTTASAGIPDLISDGRNGLMVKPGDPVILAAALLAVLKDPARAARIGVAARQRVATEFTWNRVVDRMAPVLDRVLLS